MVLVLAALFSLLSPALGAQASPSQAQLLPRIPAATAANPATAAPASSPNAGTANASILGEDPSLLLGMDLKQAIDRFGLPDAMYSARGGEAWQDDVVFQYSGGFSLFWYSGRVWQVRLSSAYPASAFGVFIGDAPDKIVSLLGQPFMSAEGSYLFNLPGRNYPIRMRAYVKAGKVADLYVYRADF
jgi:hypothetical protein